MVGRDRARPNDRGRLGSKVGANVRDADTTSAPVAATTRDRDAVMTEGRLAPAAMEGRLDLVTTGYAIEGSSAGRDVTRTVPAAATKNDRAVAMRGRRGNGVIDRSRGRGTSAPTAIATRTAARHGGARPATTAGTIDRGGATTGRRAAGSGPGARSGHAGTTGRPRDRTGVHGRHASRTAGARKAIARTATAPATARTATARTATAPATARTATARTATGHPPTDPTAIGRSPTAHTGIGRTASARTPIGHTARVWSRPERPTTQAHAPT